ncbi:hypothetical protein [Cupriavidus sp. UGS-1]|uniref:hypothetical protein n=1 Tax=Cupriavidus sp. UGS-1 TaxID=2899826 RepID=UPI001E3D57FE|nr:hypothetical protein [Cupriavidus sp. UGS-1]MCD9122286.1 hypothetical protein [Cupriavidus sp. UGS-1]
MIKPILEFLKNEAGEEEGLGDAGIETFRDAPYASCAREAGQNSRDAAADNGAPVRMTFDVFEISPHEFPSYDPLRSALSACSAEAREERAKEFFANACATADRPTIAVLKIADYNTKGLMGPPDEPGTPFHSLLKGSGVSKKESETSGGSFGIGKNASFAVSDLQTLFYSTIYKEPLSGSVHFAAQGKVKLASHTDPQGVMRRATGYWGDKTDFRAICDPAQVPQWMRRDEAGTSIFCMGFRKSKDWAERMTYSLVSNFFGAIHREDIAFEVDSGRIKVNRNTLENLMSRDDIKSAAENTGHLADLEFARQLYRCLVSEMAKEEIFDIPELGQIRVRILTEVDMPRRVGFIRNGMLITDNLRHFGHALARFPGSRDFIVLVEPHDGEAGKLLKKLENPAHSAFSAERIADPIKRSAATRAMRKLGERIRDMIRDTAGVQPQGSVVLDELGRFFAEPGKADAQPGSNAESDPEKYTYDAAKRERLKGGQPSTDEGASGGQAGKRSGGPKRDPSGRGKVGPGGGGGGGDSGSTATQIAVELRDVRNRIERDMNGKARDRVLYFSPVRSGRVALTVQALGVNAPDKLMLTACGIGTLSHGTVNLHVEAGQRYSFSVSFDEPYEGPIELLAMTADARGALA